MPLPLLNLRTKGTPEMMDRRDIHAGRVVYDRAYEMVARVVGWEGSRVALVRPAGLTWSVALVHLRPATPYEIKQLDALAKLHKIQTAGLPRSA